MLKFKIQMPSEVAVNRQFNLLDWLYEKLIKQENIDIGFYDIEIKQVNVGQDWAKNTKNIEVDCRLIPRAIWKDLPEVTGRLETGL